MLFEIKIAGKKPSFLKGTLHNSDARITTVKPEVEEAILSCDTAIFETDLSNLFMDVMFFMLKGRLPAGASLRDQIGGELFDEILEKTQQQGFDRSLFDRLQPWAAFGVLSVNLFSGLVNLPYMAMPFFAGGEFLDKLLHKMALKHGKRCIALESVHEVIRLFECIPLEDIRALLKEVINPSATENDTGLFLEKMVNAYLAGDLGSVMAANDWYGSLYSSASSKKYWEMISVGRTLKWFDKITSFVDQGGAFIAVGIVHLAGPQGLVALLRDRGYTVQQVVAG